MIDWRVVSIDNLLVNVGSLQVVVALESLENVCVRSWSLIHVSRWRPWQRVRRHALQFMSLLLHAKVLLEVR